MKQMQATHKKVGGYDFYIRPFPAFPASNISAELTKLVTPLLGGVIPIIANAEDGEFNLENIEIETALPAIVSGLSTLDGDKVEDMMKKLLIVHKNISYVDPESKETQVLDYDAVNEIFCQDIMGMYMLCWEVINLNFQGFFAKLGLQYGGQRGASSPKKTTPQNTEPST